MVVRTSNPMQSVLGTAVAVVAGISTHVVYRYMFCRTYGPSMNYDCPVCRQAVSHDDRAWTCPGCGFTPRHGAD